MRKRLIGTVTSDKMLKTRTVEVPRIFQHAKYGKILRTTIRCHVHDEENLAKMGDVVEIVECRPMSRLKRWELIRVVTSKVVPNLGTGGGDAAVVS